jgi:hypothetical protein
VIRCDFKSFRFASADSKRATAVFCDSVRYSAVTYINGMLLSAIPSGGNLALERPVAYGENIMSARKTGIRQLFKASEQPGHGGNVVLNFTGQPKSELALIGDAYYTGARRLLDAFEANAGYSDLDAYPIVFLCRHALELLIKAVLTTGSDFASLLDDPSLKAKGPYADHSLSKHIPQLKLVFEAVGWKDAFEQAGLAKGEFEQIIEEFEKFDPRSFTFRYPINKDGSASLAEKHFVFSPKQFVETLDPILKSLSGACSGLEEYLAEARAQATADAHEYYESEYCDAEHPDLEYPDFDPSW